MNKKLVSVVSAVAAFALCAGVLAFHHSDHASAAGLQASAQPLASQDVDALQRAGYAVASHSGPQVSKSIADVEKNADSWYADFHGTSMKVSLADLSKPIRKLSKSEATGDPFATKGTLDKIPCYVITIQGVNVDMSDGPAGSTPQTAHNLYLVVDASNGQTLDAFSVANH